MSENADLGDPTVFVVPPMVWSGGPFVVRPRVDPVAALPVLVVRSLGDGVRRAGDVRGEFLGLKEKKKREREEHDTEMKISYRFWIFFFEWREGV